MSTKNDVPPQPGLTLVEPTELIPGKTYLIEGPFSPYAEKRRMKGVFKANRPRKEPYPCTMTRFTNLTGPFNATLDLELQNSYYRYYEKDAVARVIIKKALHNITGDPNFTYTPSRKPSASMHAVGKKSGGNTMRNRRRRGRQSFKRRNHIKNRY